MNVARETASKKQHTPTQRDQATESAWAWVNSERMSAIETGVPLVQRTRRSKRRRVVELKLRFWQVGWREGLPTLLSTVQHSSWYHHELLLLVVVHTVTVIDCANVNTDAVTRATV